MKTSFSLQSSILIVEDDVFMQAILKEFLQQTYKVEACGNGLDALSHLQAGNIPDLIIMDLNIPRLSGMEVIAQLKSSDYFSSIPVMILSGEESSETRIKCLDAGVDDYLVKPFNPRELQARIQVILRRAGKTQAIKS